LQTLEFGTPPHKTRTEENASKRGVKKLLKEPGSGYYVRLSRGKDAERKIVFHIREKLSQRIKGEKVLT